jgi:hypothetical protein
VHGSWPTSTSMEQLLLRALQDVSNCALRNPILEMGIYFAEGESLTTIFA